MRTFGLKIIFFKSIIVSEKNGKEQNYRKRTARSQEQLLLFYICSE
jgi:hypothetical protein